MDQSEEEQSVKKSRRFSAGGSRIKTGPDQRRPDHDNLEIHGGGENR